jgi:hypothetical protein
MEVAGVCRADVTAGNADLCARRAVPARAAPGSSSPETIAARGRDHAPR